MKGHSMFTRTGLAWVGKPRAGKGMLNGMMEKTIKQHFGRHITVRQHRYSDILNETLALWGIDIHRPNSQKMARIMEDDDTGFGRGTLARAVKNRLDHDFSDVVSIDGMRWPPDEEYFKESFGLQGLIIYVKASPEIRFARAKANPRNAMDAELTWEEFVKQDNAPNEIFIEEIGKRAPIHIDNNTGVTPDELTARIPLLQTQIEEICAEKVLPLLRG
jgi:dephospho-CoA kinase